MKLEECLDIKISNFNMAYRNNKAYEFANGFEIVGNEEKIIKYLNSYFKEKGIEFITVDVSKIESKEFYYDEMPKIIEKGTPFVLYLKNYLITDPKSRYIWSTIYKNHIHCTRTGYGYTDKVFCVTTIIINDKNQTNIKELDMAEKVFLKVNFE